MIAYRYHTIFLPLTMDYTAIQSLLGEEAESLLSHECKTISKDRLHLPGPHSVKKIFAQSDRSGAVQKNLQALYGHGRLAGTGYLSILPVDQGMVSRKYADKIPFIVKMNHNELLSYPNSFDQIMFGTVQQAYDMGAVAVGATIYFGSPESGRQIVEVAAAFAEAHRLGMFTVLWCYLRNSAFKKDKDYHVSADLTGQANHLGVTLEADIIKQKLPENNGGFKAMNMEGSSYGKIDDRVYTELTTDHPIDLCRYQVANCYMGRIGLINSGGASGKNDLQQAVKTAVINKRAGGAGLISGRKAFQKPMAQGVEILNAIQDVYLCKEVTVA
ncbi:MAG: Deoxyribose-phosphate aldolase [Candidatus Peregrinibacteria bacterium GW2011_GWA2_54_9]|nr:MAG: Deoxyribose-phosphate aldolase [Candidatus Peregrinibacteria bacterium GW2011_GWA2_54_9]